MHGLVSVLDQEHSSQVEELWAELEQECGLTGIHVTPIPHFSYQIVEDYDWERLPQVLAELSAQIEPFSIRTTGLGFFTGPRVVAYLPVVRTAELSAVHAHIWQALLPVSREVSPYYAPPNWMPHISLAYQDLDPHRLQCLVQRFSDRLFNWQIAIDNLTLIYEPVGTVGSVRYQYDLGQSIPK